MAGCISAFLVSGAVFVQHFFNCDGSSDVHCAPEICMIRKQSTTRALSMQHWGTRGISQELGMALQTVTVLKCRPEKSPDIVCAPFLSLSSQSATS